MNKDKEKAKEDWKDLLKKVGESLEKLEEETSKPYKRPKDNGNEQKDV